MRNKTRAFLLVLLSAFAFTPARADDPTCSDTLVQNGCGTIVWPDGSRLVGDFQGGSFQGHARIQYGDGAIFEGDFRDGTGYGIAHYVGVDGARIDGDFIDATDEKTPALKKALRDFQRWRRLTPDESLLRVYVIVDENGRIAQSNFIVPDSFSQDDAVALFQEVGKLLSHWTFIPATIDGHPVRAPCIVNIKLRG